MASQAIWTGTISFSLVAIPVRLVPAVRPEGVAFHLLHAKDNARLSRTMICPVEGSVVPPGEIVRGYEVLPDRYVTVTAEELESLAPERSRTIEVQDFIDRAEIDPLYFDHPYYLVPSQGGEKACQLLTEVLRRTNKAGIARFVLADREHVAAVLSRGKALMLTTLHYRADIRTGGAGKARAAINAGEAARMARSIGGLAADFDPGKYTDGRRQELLALLEKKAAGGAVVETPAIAAADDAGPPDLAAALEESMRRMKERR